MKMMVKSLPVLLLLVIPVLASGCITPCAWSPVNPTATPSPAVTPTPWPSVTPAPTVTPSPIVTTTPSPAPSVTPKPNDDPYARPGWPTYGVSRILDLSSHAPTPTPVTTGSIFGRFIVEPSPIDPTYFRISATVDHVNYYTSPVSDSGTYSLTGLSFGTYEIGYEYTDYGPGTYTVVGDVTINAAHPNVEFNINLSYYP
ncbi:hypothetical protein [Methanocella arvoryzae]|uniref:Uncharacterized protein n=1 Tax=Methanocella arvoryzae (strain DSM 22066 / NBRC 105507 / MRE50) TaxID=351160 RepID=Q0W3W4_METAR|nr:hypothetical protein [Methanocella arvoryzae]CAJ36929.1 hypothetical protein RCIX1710 [Methanocella arvoryzae MRE50]